MMFAALATTSTDNSTAIVALNPLVARIDQRGGCRLRGEAPRRTREGARHRGQAARSPEKPYFESTVCSR